MGRQLPPRSFMAARRLELVVSQRVLADAIGVTIPMVAWMEKGHARVVEPGDRAIIAELLDLPIATLFFDDGYAKSLTGERLPRSHPSPLTRAKLNRVRKLTERGWSRQEIANDLGVKYHRIKQAQAELGLLPDYRGVPLESYLDGTTGSSPEVSRRAGTRTRSRRT